jgi:hypothetical protein
MVQVYFKDIEGAEESSYQAEDLHSRVGEEIPYFASSYLLSQFLLNLHRYEEAHLSGDTSHQVSYRKRALTYGKRALKNAGKYACDRVEVSMLMGIYHWIGNRQKEALKWWRESIGEGQRLGARVELARTFMEVGKRLLEKKSRYQELDGFSATDYLEKAKSLFEDLDLAWDIDELHKITAYRQARESVPRTEI